MVVYMEWIDEQLSGTTAPPYAGHTGSPPRGWVSYHCDWDSHTQGYGTWYNIDTKWRQICARHSVKFKRPKEVVW